jgi:hypothetical protein
MSIDEYEPAFGKHLLQRKSFNLRVAKNEWISSIPCPDSMGVFYVLVDIAIGLEEVTEY